MPWGDSHSQDTYNALKLAFPKVDFVNILQAGCIPTEREGCFKGWDNFYKNYLDGNKKIEGIIISSRYTGRGFKEFSKDLESGYYRNSRLALVNAGPISSGLVNDVLNEGRLENYKNKKKIKKCETRSTH